MALKKETIDKLKAFGIDTDKLIAAIVAETEQDLELPEVTALTPAQLTERDNVKIAEGKKQGETEARSILVKELSKSLNVELKGERIADVVSEIQAFANKNGDEKVKLLQDQVTALTADKSKLTGEITEFKNSLSAAKFDSELIGLFPANRGAGLSDSERLTLIKNAITFEIVDGKQVAKRDGVVVTDPVTHAPLPVSKVIEGYFTEKPLLLGNVPNAAPGGRGGVDTPPGGGGLAGIKKFSEAEKAWKEQNPTSNLASPDFMNYVNKLAKEDPSFDYDS
jgi:hypothetical protein